MKKFPKNLYKRLLSNQDIRLQPPKKSQTLIFLHGLGDTAFGWEPVFTDPSSNFAGNETEIILLTAPSSSVTLNMGMVMPSWFDILGLTASGKSYNYNDALSNSTRIMEIIEQEVKHFDGDSSKVFIGGFSQGAAMALDVYTRSPHKLGGALAFSGFMFEQNKTPNSEDWNIFISHCENDEVLPFKLSMLSYERFKGLEKVERVTTKYVGHSIDNNVLSRARQFFNKLT